jgi:hypothetical protein
VEESWTADLIKGADNFFFYAWIPILLLWGFIVVVRMARSNVAGLISLAIMGILLGVLISSTSYKSVYEVGRYLLIPVFGALIISGYYHEQYRLQMRDIDPVHEQIKAQIQKELEEKKTKLVESKKKEEKEKARQDYDEF